MPNDPIPRRVVRRIPTAGARPVQPPNNGDVDRGYWYGYADPPERREEQSYPAREQPLIPTGEQLPPSAPNAQPATANFNCPPWVCPPFWAKPFELSLSLCTPFWGVANLCSPGCYTVPDDYMLILRNVSYELGGLSQYDAFQLTITGGLTPLTIEDMLIDPTASNPAERFAMAGHVRMQPMWLMVRNSQRLCVNFTALGQLALDGTTNHIVGDVIPGGVQGNIFLQGWLANIRENIDGGQNVDLGNLDFSAMGNPP